MVATLLVRAGIGRLILIDDDRVAPDNLHRQLFFTENDAKQKRLKAEALAQSLQKGNSQTILMPIAERLTEENVSSIWKQFSGDTDRLSFDILIDAADNFTTRILLNRLAIENNTPLVSGGVMADRGQAFTILPRETPCLGCLFDLTAIDTAQSDNASREEFSRIGILPTIVSVIAAIETDMALKILTGRRQHLANEMITIDLWGNHFKTINLGRPLPECLICQSHFVV